MFQGMIENAMRRPTQRDDPEATAAGRSWAMGRLEQSMDDAANPRRHASREEQTRRKWAGNWVSSGDGEGRREPGTMFGSQPPRQNPPEVNEGKLRDTLMSHFQNAADQEDGPFGPDSRLDFSGNLTQALAASSLPQSVASQRSAQAASDSLAASNTTPHPDRQGGAPMATDNKQPGMDTVQGQMTDLMSQDNNLMKQARTSALQGANKRGLLNSSMAVGASQDAMVRNAMPIAQQDAGALQDLNKLQASSMANAWGVMANNSTDIVAQGMEGIANIQANPDIKPEDKSKMIEQITQMRDTDIQFQQDLYSSLPDYLGDTGLFPNA